MQVYGWANVCDGGPAIDWAARVVISAHVHTEIMLTLLVIINYKLQIKPFF